MSGLIASVAALSFFKSSDDVIADIFPFLFMTVLIWEEGEDPG